jgi:subtilisin family serine protease
MRKTIVVITLAALGSLVIASPIAAARFSHAPRSFNARPMAHHPQFKHPTATRRPAMHRAHRRMRHAHAHHHGRPRPHHAAPHHRNAMWRHMARWHRPPIARSAPAAPLRTGFHVPPPREWRYMPREVLLDSTVDRAEFMALSRHHRFTVVESIAVRLTGRTLYRVRIDDGRSVPDLIRALADDGRVASAQPNYLYTLQQHRIGYFAPRRSAVPQYVSEKLRLSEAHRLATGQRVLVAVIDSGIDGMHPYLHGAIVEKVSVFGDRDEADEHGTAMAGAIADRGDLVGVAPRSRILAIRAFAPRPRADAVADTVRITQAIDVAVQRGARVINMSFAGPDDPGVAARIETAHSLGIVLVAAAGNAGPKAPAQYPAAYPQVIAVTATDVDDRVFEQANGGSHIAVAAPGVDVLAIVPDGGVGVVSGTSIAAAHVSGVVALLIERRPAITPDEVRRIVTASAVKPKTPVKGRDMGAGRVDAYAALRLLGPRLTAGAPPIDPTSR